MKKLLIISAIAFALVSAPQTASASWWSDFIFWIRSAPPGAIEQIQRGEPIPGVVIPQSENKPQSENTSESSEVVQQSSIKIISPKAEDSYVVGGKISIRWNGVASEEGYTIQLKNLNTNEATIIANISKDSPTRLKDNSGANTYVWTIPSWVNGKYQVEVYPPTSRELTGRSGVFIITNPAPATPASLSEVKVTSPNGGESIALGESIGVHWNSSNPTQAVDVQIVNSSGVVVKYQNNLRPANANAQSLGFTSSASGALALPLGEYKARVCISGTTKCDDSNGYFKLIAAVTNVAPVISQINPQPVAENGTVTVYVTNAGRQGNIVVQTADGSRTWTNGYGVDVTNLNGFIRYDGSRLTFTLPTVIGRGVHPDGWWNEPQMLLGAGDYKVYVTSLDAQNNFIKSNIVSLRVSSTAGTTTKPPVQSSQTSSIRVVSPNGGEQLRPGAGGPIKWYGGSSTGEKIRFDLVNVSTGVKTWIASDVVPSSDLNYSNGIISWSLPSNTVPGQYKIRISRQSDGVIIDESDAAFTALEPLKGISVDQPYYGVQYHVGQTMPIKFTPVNFPSGQAYTIDLVKWEGTGTTLTKVMTINSLTKQTTHSWVVPANVVPGSQYFIKICPSGYAADLCSTTNEITVLPDPSASVSPSPTASPSGSTSRSSKSNFIANVFYAIGDSLDAGI